MGKLFVSDTNIFIDLIHMGLLGDFFLLPFDIYTFDIYTVDFVVGENKWLPEKIVTEFILELRSLTAVNSL